MIYDAGIKKYRRKEWFTTPAPGSMKVRDAHYWCTQQSSAAKFYYHYTNTRWWFEDEKDAVIFALMFGARV